MSYLKVLTMRRFAYRCKILVPAGVGGWAGPVRGWHTSYNGRLVTGAWMDTAAGATAALAHRIYLSKEICTAEKYRITMRRIPYIKQSTIISYKLMWCDTCQVNPGNISLTSHIALACSLRTNGRQLQRRQFSNLDRSGTPKFFPIPAGPNTTCIITSIYLLTNCSQIKSKCSQY